MKKYALISLSDKENLEILVAGLIKHNFSLIATTSSAKAIKELGYDCQLVEELTNFPEMLGGRVKTLQPEIHGGILANLDLEEHLEDLKNNNINPISLVVCNLYPFYQVLDKEIERHLKVLANPESGEAVLASINEMEYNAIENIDIGGVTLLRAAAKNYKHVSLLADPNDYCDFIEKMDNDLITLEYRQQLASKGFIMTADYDSKIANYYMSKTSDEQDHKIDQLLISAPLKQKLRYGENPDQMAFYFEEKDYTSFSLKSSEILQGKALSYNNMLDIDAAYNAIYEFTKPCAIALKHNTPCGAGFGMDAYAAYEACYRVDPVSIFGGVVIINQKVEEELAIKLNEIFLEIVIAPDYSSDALKEFCKKKNLRVIKGDFNREEMPQNQIKSINGGYLYQDKMPEDFICSTVTSNSIIPEIVSSLTSLYKVVKNVKSNAIVIASSTDILGISGGMVSRVDAVDFALSKAIQKDNYIKDEELLLASDGFFPFNDIVEYAIKYNIKYIIQPGGSLNDNSLIEACNNNDINMIFTNTRFFKH